METRSRTLFAALAAALAVAPASARDIDKGLIDAAKKEGKLVFYTSYVTPLMHAAVKAGFEKAFGIPVELLNVRANEMNERVRVEQASGRFLGDVVQHGQASITRFDMAGNVQDMGAIAAAADLIDGQPAQPRQIGSFIAAYAISANANMLAPEARPKGWMDLTDPKWKGKILADDMRAAGGGNTIFSATYAKLGEDFHRRLAANDIVLSHDVGEAERRVARGEYPIYMSQIASDLAGLRGLPLALIVPVEGVPYVRLDLAELKNAPHPNAARLFIEWYLSEENQKRVAAFGVLPVVKGASSALPPEALPMAQAKFMGTIEPETQQKMLDLATAIYK
jgi:iron(III) transport system substrate-binding protein